MAKIKINMQMENEMKDYVEEQAERLGVSQSGFVNMCIANYKEQRESIRAMNNVKDLVFKLDDIQRQLNKK